MNIQKFLCIMLLPVALNATSFGKNKVQYSKFNWKIHPTPHFEVFFYEGEEELAKFASIVLENELQRMTSILGKPPATKVPIIIYANHCDFEQTNVILDLIEEGVGGFTELYKNRVVVPFTGSYEDFRHVLTHELTHILQSSAIKGDVTSILPQDAIYRIPLWFIEGMAEYMSLREDPETDLILRDLIYYDKLIPIQEIWKIEGSYLMYKEGQSILKFIADRYGEQKIGEIYHKISFIGGFDEALKQSVGIDQETLSREWTVHLNKKAWNNAINTIEIPEGARHLTKRDKNYTYNIAPSISPDGSAFVFMSDRDQYGSIYLASAITGKLTKKLIESGKSRGFESIYIMEGSISWSPEGKYITFISKRENRDVIYILNPYTNKIVKQLTPPPPALSSPVFSRDSKSIAFRGVVGGRADIYIIDIETGKTKQLTDDIYDDRTPGFSSDRIFFASDRPDSTENWKYGEYAIYSMNIDGMELHKVVTTRSRETESPIVYDDTLICYLSNYSGITDLYCLNLKTGEEKQLTNITGGIESYSISNKGKMLFSLYINRGWDIFSMQLPFTGFAPSEYKTYNIPYVAVDNFDEPVETAEPGLRFSPDFAGGIISASTDEFYAQAYIAVSDVLGNHRFYLITDYPGNILESNFNFIYWHLENRANFGFAVFKEQYPSLVWYDVLINEKYTGGGMALEYPLDKFRRLESEFYLYSIERIRYQWNYRRGEWVAFEDTTNYVAPLSLSYVFDNTLWSYMGPVNGTRMRFSVAHTVSFTSSFLSYAYAGADIRKYFRILPGYYLAARLFGESIRSKDFAKLRIGGTGSIRGYDYLEFAGYNIGGINLEFRYPFINHLGIGFPLPLEIYGIRGALFLDAGYAVDDLRSLRIFADGRLKDLKMGFGAGIRIRFPYFVLLLDMAKKTDLVDISKGIRYHITLGNEF